MKISCSRLAWNSSDCFESFSPLNVTEGVITTWSNRMKFRLDIDLYKANDSLVQHKEIYIKHYITSIIHNPTNIGIKILTISFANKKKLMDIQMLRGFSEKVHMIQAKIWL